MFIYSFISILFFSFNNQRGSSDMTGIVRWHNRTLRMLPAIEWEFSHRITRRYWSQVHAPHQMSPPESQIYFWPEEKWSLSRENDKLRWKGFQTSKSSWFLHFCDSLKKKQARMLLEIRITRVSNSLGQFKRESFCSDQTLRRVKSLWHFEEKTQMHLRFVMK